MALDASGSSTGSALSSLGLFDIDFELTRVDQDLWGTGKNDS